MTDPATEALIDRIAAQAVEIARLTEECRGLRAKTGLQRDLDSEVAADWKATARSMAEQATAGEVEEPLLSACPPPAGMLYPSPPLEDLSSEPSAKVNGGGQAVADSPASVVDVARDRLAIKPAFRSDFTVEADAELRRCHKAGKSWKQTAQSLAAMGYDFSPRKVQNRAFAMGLRAADRDNKPLHWRDVRKADEGYRAPEPVRAETRIMVPQGKKPVVAAVAVVAVVPAPEPPTLSRMATIYGERMVELADNFLSPDDIVAEINRGAAANDRVNAGTVRKVLVEMRSHARRDA